MDTVDAQITCPGQRTCSRLLTSHKKACEAWRWLGNASWPPRHYCHQTTQGDVKHFNDVQYAPNLAHNLLSVAQVMKYGYKIEFNDDSCTIVDKKNLARL